MTGSGTALLRGRRGVARAGAEGAVDWLEPDPGRWSIAPAEPFEAARRHLPGTAVLETTFTTAGGSVRLVDALSLGDAHELLRHVEGVSGVVRLAVELSGARGALRTELTVRAGERVGFALRWPAPPFAGAVPTAPQDVPARIVEVVDGWRAATDGRAGRAPAPG